MLNRLARWHTAGCYGMSSKVPHNRGRRKQLCTAMVIGREKRGPGQLHSCKSACTICAVGHQSRGPQMSQHPANTNGTWWEMQLAATYAQVKVMTTRPGKHHSPHAAQQSQSQTHLTQLGQLMCAECRLTKCSGGELLHLSHPPHQHIIVSCAASNSSCSRQTSLGLHSKQVLENSSGRKLLQSVQGLSAFLSHVLIYCLQPWLCQPNCSTLPTCQRLPVTSDHYITKRRERGQAQEGGGEKGGGRFG